MIKHLLAKDFASFKNYSFDSLYHFSFADYHDPNNISFGKLRVYNDETIRPSCGYDLHLHRNMEVFSYIIEGELTHKDSLDNLVTLKKGDFQLMSSGKGIYHNEYNLSNVDLRIIKFWIIPSKRNLDPNYCLVNINDLLQFNSFTKIISINDAPIIINQDINVYILKLEKTNNIHFETKENRQVYYVQIDGSALINNLKINPKDAIIAIEENLNIYAITSTHSIVFEMLKD